MADNDDLLRFALKRIVELRETLRRAESRELLDDILIKLGRETSPTKETEVRIAGLLGALAGRGETEDELAGFADSLRARLQPFPLNDEERSGLVDTCGTGGDGGGTFNISTAAALVAAAAGAVVAKHGNRAVTSKCGSADVLEGLGIPIDLSVGRAAEALRRHGFAFLPAPAMHPVMKATMPIRRAMGVRTMFSILGPMANPAGAQAQVLGVYTERLVPLVAGTLLRLGARRAFVVHGSDGAGGAGMDEFSICGRTVVGEVQGGAVRVGSVTPEDFGLAVAPFAELAGSDATGNAAILRQVFAGERGARRDAVVMNAGAVLVAAGIAVNFSAGARLAERTIDAGEVTGLVEGLAAERV